MLPCWPLYFCIIVCTFLVDQEDQVKIPTFLSQVSVSRLVLVSRFCRQFGYEEFWTSNKPCCFHRFLFQCSCLWYFIDLVITYVLFIKHRPNSKLCVLNYIHFWHFEVTKTEIEGWKNKNSVFNIHHSQIDDMPETLNNESCWGTIWQSQIRKGSILIETFWNKLFFFLLKVCDRALVWGDGRWGRFGYWGRFCRFDR